jgi:hypothetical protein
MRQSFTQTNPPIKNLYVPRKPLLDTWNSTLGSLWSMADCVSKTTTSCCNPALALGRRAWTETIFNRSIDVFSHTSSRSFTPCLQGIYPLPQSASAWELQSAISSSQWKLAHIHCIFSVALVDHPSVPSSPDLRNAPAFLTHKIYSTTV